jgi:hypothetical protein
MILRREIMVMAPLLFGKYDSTGGGRLGIIDSAAQTDAEAR